MSARILVLDLAPEDGYEAREFGDVEAFDAADPRARERLVDAECLIVSLAVAVDRAMIDAAPRLRHIVVFGTSCAGVDVEHARRRGIEVRSIHGYSTQAVAEFTIAAILSNLRGLQRARARAASGDYSEPAAPGRQLAGRSLGIVGLGRIGRRVAEVAAGLGARVRYWSRTRRPDGGIECADLDSLVAGSEVLTVHVALAGETRAMIDAARVRSMPPDALLVAFSHPEIIDMEEVVRRVEADELRFVTDHADEIHPRHVGALRRSPLCDLYPAIGYRTREADEARRRGLVEVLKECLRSPR